MAVPTVISADQRHANQNTPTGDTGEQATAGLPMLDPLRRETPTSSLHCQRWATGRRQRWQLAAPGDRFDARRYEVHRIDRSVAAPFVVARHYSGAHVACRQSFGLFRSGALVGVASYCVSSAQALQLAYPELTPGVESLELGRFVITDDEPGNVETWLDARCREYLFTSGVRAVLSFAV